MHLHENVANCFTCQQFDRFYTSFSAESHPTRVVSAINKPKISRPFLPEKGTEHTQPADDEGAAPFSDAAELPELQFVPSALALPAGALGPTAEVPLQTLPPPSPAATAAAAPVTTFTSGPQLDYSPQGVIRVANGTFVDDACREFTFSGWNQCGFPNPIIAVYDKLFVISIS